MGVELGNRCRGHGFRRAPFLHIETELLVGRAAAEREHVVDVPGQIKAAGFVGVDRLVRPLTDDRRIAGGRARGEHEVGRVGDVERVVESRQVRIGIVVGVAVDIITLERDGGLLRVGADGTRDAGKAGQAEVVCEFGFEVDRVLEELRRQNVDPLLGTDVHIVESALHERGVVIDDTRDEVDAAQALNAGFACERNGLEEFFRTRLVKLGVEGVYGDLRAFPRLNLEGARDAKAFTVIADPAIARNARVRAARGGDTCRGPGEYVAVGIRHSADRLVAARRVDEVGAGAAIIGRDAEAKRA